MDLSEYKHKIEIRVRTFEVDSQGIVHNINYLKYLEIGRVEYRRNMGYHILPNGIFNDGLKVVVVRNEIDYISFSYLDDLLTVFTKIVWIKNSSFCFEQIIQKNSDKTIICRALGVLVNINNMNISEKLPLEFIKQIKNFETNLKLN
ncbi:MAG: acyl-CoA thioesterase [Ignavibacteria bacterium]|nr:acyl-CoA thioesterase [Ignavibacteria bacterium]